MPRSGPIGFATMESSWYSSQVYSTDPDPASRLFFLFLSCPILLQIFFQLNLLERKKERKKETINVKSYEEKVRQ